MSTLACAHINISPFLHENLPSVWNWQYDNIRIHWLMSTWEKSNSKNWQATPSEKGDCNSCTSTDLLSCSWLRMSSSLGSCTTSDLQANSEEEGGDAWKGGQEMDGGRKTKPTQFTITFQTHLTSLNHPSPSAKLRLTGTHLPFCSWPGAQNSETKEDYRHHAEHWDKQCVPSLRARRCHACFHYLSSSSSSLLLTVWALLSLVIFCRR